MTPMPTSGRRSHKRSAAVLLRMPPELLEQIDTAAGAAQRTRIRYLLELIEQGLPQELDLSPEPSAEEVRMAS